MNAAHNHSGMWSCHMGATHVAATDTVQEISVRITGTRMFIRCPQTNGSTIYNSLSLGWHGKPHKYMIMFFSLSLSSFLGLKSYRNTLGCDKFISRRSAGYVSVD